MLTRVPQRCETTQPAPGVCTRHARPFFFRSAVGRVRLRRVPPQEERKPDAGREGPSVRRPSVDTLIDLGLIDNRGQLIDCRLLTLTRSGRLTSATQRPAPFPRPGGLWPHMPAVPGMRTSQPYRPGTL